MVEAHGFQTQLGQGLWGGGSYREQALWEKVSKLGKPKAWAERVPLGQNLGWKPGVEGGILALQAIGSLCPLGKLWVLPSCWVMADIHGRAHNVFFAYARA
jgi:hypothetical protein